MVRKRLSQFVLEQRHKGVVEIRDADSPLVFRVQGEAKRFTVRARIKGDQHPIRVTYPKAADATNLNDARQWAQKVVADCKTGIDPRVAMMDAAEQNRRAVTKLERQRFGAVVQRYLERRVRREKQNRTADESERIFNRYILPRWKDRNIHEIGRADVNALLDDIADGKIEGAKGQTYGTPGVADQVLAQLQACLGWYQVQDDKFVSPVVAGMRRTTPSKMARDRVLSPEEIRALWRVLPDFGLFGKMVQVLLLTAQRRDEVAGMKRSEISGDIWTIPAERYKTSKPNIVPLTKRVLAVLDSIDQINKSDLVFTTTGETAFSGFSKAKARLDGAMQAELGEASLVPWRLHDLRRSARSLMSRAGVRPDISERVMGHVIAGVEGVYDRHDYAEQKRAALETLEAMIERIVNLPACNVVPLRETAE